MKLDKRNPFAVWGFEQEVYTTEDNITAGYQNPVAADETKYNTVAEMPNIELNNQASFFTNNENMSPVQIQNYALHMDNELQPEYNSNEELHYYGIQADDLKKNESSVVEEETEEEETTTGTVTGEPGTGNPFDDGGFGDNTVIIPNVGGDSITEEEIPEV